MRTFRVGRHVVLTLALGGVPLLLTLAAGFEGRVAAAHAVQPAAQPLRAAPFDMLIVNGRVMDGTGNPWMRADIAIRDGRIAAVGRLRGAAAARTIDAADRLVTPGFIDVHTHAAEGMTRPGLEQARPYLAQGVTTLVVNPDGGGPVDLGAQRRQFETTGIGPNVALLIGHGTVRQAVLGMADRAPSGTELGRMQKIVRTAMEAGAYGMSSGLFYAPGSYARTDEVIALMRVVGEYGGFHTSHIRDESNYTVGVVASVNEIIEIAEATGTRGVATHLKALGPDSWGLAVAAAMRIDLARRRGVEVFADQYPYEASSTSLTGALIPRWAQVNGNEAMRTRFTDPALADRLRRDIRENLARRGGAGTLVIAHYGADHSLEGQSLEAVAKARGEAPEDTAMALLLKGNASLVSFNMIEDDIVHVMRQPWTMASSDGGLVAMGQGRPHPRGYGAHARRLARYVRERRVISLEHAVRSMTTLPAAVVGIRDRGVIREGAWADLAIFDPDAVQDRATYEAPHQLAAGMDFVLVNGVPVIDNGTFTEARPGRVLQRE